MINVLLGRRVISNNSKPYIIAEIGVNHEGSFDQAIKLIDLAKKGGADAVKFQSYKANTLASKNSPAYWDKSKEPTSSQHELFKKYDSFNEGEYTALSKYCNNIGIEFLSTPFDDDSIDFLDSLMPFYKIASADLTNLPLLRKVAKKNKPIVLSTGASTLGEIDVAIEILRTNNCNEIVLLHCILNYPTNDNNANLSMISNLKKTYPEYVIGYSDHTLPDENMTSLVTSYLLGAKVIEKHFTHDKLLPGNDHYHSMDVNDLKNFKSILKKVDILKGNENIKKPIATESISRLNARRSIVLVKNVEAGHVLTELDLICKRPGTGISPLYWDEVIGCVVLSSIKEDSTLQWNDLQKKI
jgi:sialic acid synthase SpsE